MTIKELKEKIEVLSNAIEFPALPNTNAILREALKDMILQLQAQLIEKLSTQKRILIKREIERS